MNPVSFSFSKPHSTGRRLIGLAAAVLTATTLLSACGQEDTEYQWRGWRYEEGLSIEGRRTYSASASSNNADDLPGVGSSRAYLTFSRARDLTRTIAFETGGRFVCDNRWDCPVEVSFDMKGTSKYSGRINLHGDAIVIDISSEMDDFYEKTMNAESIRVRLIFEGRIVSYWFDVEGLDIDDWW